MAFLDDQISVFPLLRELPCPFHLRNESIYFSLWVLVPLSLEKKIEEKNDEKEGDRG